MSAVEKLNWPAAELNPDEHLKLFRWWTESGGFRSASFAALKRDIAAGIDDLDNGRFQTCSEANVMAARRGHRTVGTARFKKSGP